MLPSNTFSVPVADTVIDETDATALWSDLATALTLCTTNDGQTTSPILTNPKILTKILDTNSNELLEFGTSGSAVNHLKVSNAASGNNPVLSVTGEANQGLLFNDSNATQLLRLAPVASAVNWVRVTNSATGNPALISAEGSDTNIDISLAPKGTGGVYGSVTTHPSSPFATTSGTSVAVTGIPDWAKKITISFYRVSADGTADSIFLRIGDAGGLHATGYEDVLAAVTGANTCVPSDSTVLILLNNSATQAAASSYSGHLTITREDASNFNYVASGIMSDYLGGGLGDAMFTAGSTTLDTVLTQFTLNIAGGGSFDAGSFSVHYEG